MPNDRGIENALKIFSKSFYKIISINLDEDTFNIIYLGNDELPKCKNINEWFLNYVSKGFIHPDDIDRFFQITNVNNIRKNIDIQEDPIRVYYRRMVKNNWRWVCCEVMKNNNYSKENPEVLMFIKDIHDDYIAQIANHQDLQYKSEHDDLTGLCNYRAYESMIQSIEANMPGAIGVVYADLNNLKIINDNQGHSAGNKYLKDFSRVASSIFRKSECFRIGGDEFVIIICNIENIDFQYRLLEFYNALTEEQVDVAIGTIWTDDEVNIRYLIQQAEKKMYANKRHH